MVFPFEEKTILYSPRVPHNAKKSYGKHRSHGNLNDKKIQI